MIPVTCPHSRPRPIAGEAVEELHACAPRSVPGYRNGTGSASRGRKRHSAVVVIAAAGGLAAAAEDGLAGVLNPAQ